MWVFCPDAMYFPVFATSMTEISLSWPYTIMVNFENETYSEELLCSRDNVSDNQSCSERVDDMFVVRMEDQSIVDLA